MVSLVVVNPPFTVSVCTVWVRIYFLLSCSRKHLIFTYRLKEISVLRSQILELIVHVCAACSGISTQFSFLRTCGCLSALRFLENTIFRCVSKSSSYLWNLIFSLRWQFWLCFFGLYRRVDWLVEANVSEKLAFSIFRAEGGWKTSSKLFMRVCAPVCLLKLLGRFLSNSVR
jgi:hypothetical protein